VLQAAQSGAYDRRAIDRLTAERRRGEDLSDHPAGGGGAGLIAVTSCGLR
jgi:hypothetical protein